MIPCFLFTYVIFLYYKYLFYMVKFSIFISLKKNVMVMVVKLNYFNLSIFILPKKMHFF